MDSKFINFGFSSNFDENFYEVLDPKIKPGTSVCDDCAKNLILSGKLKFLFRTY